MSEIIIYTSEDGNIQLNVNLSQDTVWLSQQQIAELFGTKRQAITKHLKNIFFSQELKEEAVCSILEHTAKDGKKYQTKFYALDAIISVGYRVNSAKATQFRIWATALLKEHLIQGYTLDKLKIWDKGIHELKQTMGLLQRALANNELISDLGANIIQIILSYSKTWHLLLAYDEDKLVLPANSQSITKILSYAEALQAIHSLKEELGFKKEATSFFGQERNGALSSILNNIEQTFFEEALYKTPEEKAAHLLYFIIKDHPFIDGNKRIGCFLFLIYLKIQNIPLKLNDNGLVALALLIAESNPSQKDLMTRLSVNLLMNIKNEE